MKASASDYMAAATDRQLKRTLLPLTTKRPVADVVGLKRINVESCGANLSRLFGYFGAGIAYSLEKWGQGIPPWKVPMCPNQEVYDL